MFCQRSVQNGQNILYTKITGQHQIVGYMLLKMIHFVKAMTAALEQQGLDTSPNRGGGTGTGICPIELGLPNGGAQPVPLLALWVHLQPAILHPRPSNTGSKHLHSIQDTPYMLFLRYQKMQCIATDTALLKPQHPCWRNQKYMTCPDLTKQ